MILLLFLKLLAIFITINLSVVNSAGIKMPMALKIIILEVGVLKTNEEYIAIELILNNKGQDNATVDILMHFKVIPQTTKVSIYLQKDNGKGEYSNIGVPIKKEACEFIRQDKMFYPDFVKAGNFPKNCPLSPGKYYVKDYVINTKQLPAVLPTGKFRFLINLDIDSKTLLWRGYGIVNIAN